MSFPKAKLHRFNEEVSCAPPPGKYDPKFDTDVKGGVIEKSKRFIEPKLSSASSAESLDSAISCSLSRSSSLRVLPVFRTPQLKKKVPKTPKTVSTINFSGCNQFEKHKLEKKFREDTSRLEEENMHLIKQLQEKDNENSKLMKELNNFQENEKIEQLKIVEERKILEDMHKEEIQGYVTDIEDLKKVLEEEKERQRQEMELVTEKWKEDLELIRAKNEERLKTVEAEFDIYRMEKEVNFKMEFDKTVQEMNNWISEVEDQVKGTAKCVCEMEVRFGKEVDDLNSFMKETEIKLESILSDLEELAKEKETLIAAEMEERTALKEAKENLNTTQKQLARVEGELQKSWQKCKNFHVATMEHRKTIEALSIRLYESESEVERLNSVQSDLEGQKAILEEKAENLVMEIIGLRESMRSMESEIIRDVEGIKSQLTAKVDSYRLKAAEETKALLDTLEEKQRTIDMLLAQNDFYRNRLKEMEVYADSLKMKSDKQNVEITDLKKKLTEIEDEFTERINAQKNVYSILDGNYKEKCETVAKLRQIRSDQEVRIEELMVKLDHQSECAQRASAQINNLAVDNQNKEARIENLLKEIEAGREYINSVTKHVESVVAELNAKEQQIKMLQQEIEVKTATAVLQSKENDELKAQVEQKMCCLEELKKEFRETHKNNEKYVDELISEIFLEKERYSELSQLVLQLEEEKAKLEDDIKKALLEKEDLSNHCTSLNEEISRLSETLVNETNERSRLTRVVEESRDEAERLESNLQRESIEKAQLILELSTKIDNLEDLLIKSDETRKTIETENISLTEKLSKLNEAVSELETVKDSIFKKSKELEGQVEEMSRTIEEQSLDNNRLQSQVEELKNNEVVIACLKDEIEILCDNIDTKEKEIKELMEKSEKTVEIDVTGLKEQIETLNARLENETKSKEELMKSLSKMEARKNEYKLHSCRVAEEMDAAKEEIKKLKEDLTRLNEEKARLAVTIGPFMRQLRDFEEERNLLASRKEAVEEELHALERKQAQALGHHNLKQKIHYVSKLKEENIQLKLAMDQLSLENIRLKSKCKDMEKASRENTSPRASKKHQKEGAKEREHRVHSPGVLRDRN